MNTSSKEAPSGHFINHPFGNPPANQISCTIATPLEEMNTITTTGARTTYVQGVIADNTPHRTVKVVNYNPNQPQFVQQIPNGTMPVQYVTVNGQPVYQAVVVNQTPGQQPVVYHNTTGTIIQQQYYQQVPQSSGGQTITVNGQINQPYAGHTAPGPIHVQHGVAHTSHPYQSQASQSVTSAISQSHTQPAPSIDPRTIVTRAPEPIFNQMPDSFTTTKVLHSTIYKKYVELYLGYY